VYCAHPGASIVGVDVVDRPSISRAQASKYFFSISVITAAAGYAGFTCSNLGLGRRFWD
jgi:hypothetical protein